MVDDGKAKQIKVGGFMWEAIGHAGNLLSFFVGVPQIIKIYRTKSAKDLSIISYSLLLLIQILPLAYILNSGGDRVMIIRFTIGIFMVSWQLILCLIYGKAKKKHLLNTLEQNIDRSLYVFRV